MDGIKPLINPQLNPKTGAGSKGIGSFLIVVSATSFAFMAIFIKFAYRAGLNIPTVLSLRFLIAAVVMWVVLLISGQSPRVTRKQLFSLLALGTFGYGVMSTCFFKAVQLIPASMASIMLYTYPIIVTLLSAWVNKEQITKTRLIALLVSSVGLLLVVGADFEGGNATGLLYGGAAAIVYSLYIIFSNKLVSKVDPLVVTTYVITSAALVTNLSGVVTGSITWEMSLQGWLAVLAIALVSTVIAILTFFQGMRLVGPSQASIISSLEPVITAVAAFVIFTEKITLGQVIGGIMVLGAVMLIQRAK